MSNFNTNDIRKITSECQAVLDLKNARHVDEDYYQSLPFCIIDSVFSIGVKYVNARNAVIKFCNYYNLQRIRNNKTFEYPEISDQLSISSFVSKYNDQTLQDITDKIYNNRQRTSARNGILKSEAVLKFAETALSYDVNYFQDIPRIVNNPSFEKDIKNIPGQKSGLSLRYFFMLTGQHQYVKPDRMIMRFIESVTGKTPDMDEAQKLITSACHQLENNFPHLSPMLLDNQIWSYQRDKQGRS